VGLSTSTLTGLMGQARIFYRMSCDGLFYPMFGRLSPARATPRATHPTPPPPPPRAAVARKGAGELCPASSDAWVLPKRTRSRGT